MATFDADTYLQAPITFEDLFFEHSTHLMPIVKSRYVRRWDGCWAMLGDLCAQYPFDTMTYFPVIVYRSTLKKLRQYVQEKRGMSFAAAFAEMASTGVLPVL